MTLLAKMCCRRWLTPKKHCSRPMLSSCPEGCGSSLLLLRAMSSGARTEAPVSLDASRPIWWFQRCSQVGTGGRAEPSQPEPTRAGVLCRRRHRWLCAALEKPGVDRPLDDRRFGRTLARAPFVRNGRATAKPSAASLPVGAWKPAACKRAELRLDDRWSLVHSCVCTDVLSPGSKLSWYPHCILEQQGCGASRLPHS
jgi:hypothetical protein